MNVPSNAQKYMVSGDTGHERESIPEEGPLPQRLRVTETAIHDVHLEKQKLGLQQ